MIPEKANFHTAMHAGLFFSKCFTGNYRINTFTQSKFLSSQIAKRFFLLLFFQYLLLFEGPIAPCWDHNAFNIAGCLWKLPDIPRREFTTAAT